MKKHLSTILLVIIFFIGLSVLLYPTLADYVNSKHQSRAIAEYVQAMSQIDPDKYAEELAKAQAYNESLVGNTTRFVQTEETLAAYHDVLDMKNTAIGYIEIPSIRVDLPLYLGTEESVLQVGAGCMPGSSLPIGGPSTHAVLTGHRGLPSARLFTDLDQLVPGDTFVVFMLNEVLTYQIDQIRIVLPQEMEELAIAEGEDYCTLVTCTPYGVNTHRMLVRGKRIENIEADTVAARVTADAIQVDPLLVTPIVAAPLLLILLMILLTPKGKKKGKRVK